MRSYSIIIALVFLMSCGSDPSADNDIINVQRQEITKLKEQIKKSDDFVNDFTARYDQVLLNLDSIVLIKDSLELISKNGATYDEEKIADLQSRLNLGQATIDELRRRLADNADDNATLSFLRSELNRAQTRITDLENNRKTLVAENDSIRDALENSIASFEAAQSRALESEKSLISANDARLEAETEKSKALKKAELAILAAERERKRAQKEKANIFFQEAESGFEKLEEYIQYSRNGEKITINKKGIRQKFALQEAKNIATQIYKDLSEAAHLGHPDAEDKIQQLLNYRKYKQVAPVGN